MNKKNILLLALLLLFCVYSFALDANIYSSQIQAEKDKVAAFGVSISSMKENGFTVTRMLDELSILRQTAENNIYKIENNQLPDFETFNARADALDKILIEAQQIKDELVALKTTIDGLKGTIDITPLTEMRLEAEKEFADERYEYAIKQIDATYEKVSELQGIQAKANAAYDATRRSVLGFISENWGYILIVVLIPVIGYLIFRKKITLYRLNKRIEEVRFEEGVLKDEIKKAQELYFVGGKLPEAEYSIKVKMYGEKIRDLNRLAAVFEEKKEEILQGSMKSEEKKPLNK
ncbi:MAG: hypothetical protein WCW44_00025 [archaeon]